MTMLWFVFFFDLMNGYPAGMKTQHPGYSILDLREIRIDQIHHAAWPLTFLWVIVIDSEQLVTLLGPVIV